MDLYIYDTSFNLIKILDTYKSLIWVERYNEYGDFELCMVMSPDVLEYIKQDYYIERNDSERTMIIEKIKIETDIEEGNTIIVTGRSLESILLRRIIWGQRSFKGKIHDGIKTLITENIISPTDTNRKISNFVFEDSTDWMVLVWTTDAQFTGDNLYDAIHSLCAEREFGFKVIRNADNEFVFSLYLGIDRSYSNPNFDYVAFSPSYDNIINSNYMESKSSLKNATLIGGEGEGANRRYATVGETSGLERREMFTDARDITSDIDIDKTDLINFSYFDYPNQVYSYKDGKVYSNQYFNSTYLYITPYIGYTIRMTIPKYTNLNGEVSGYATTYFDQDEEGSFIFEHGGVIKIWEKNGDTPNQGSLETYEFVVKPGYPWIYVTMFSQKAIDDGVYYGELSDFSCKIVKVSDEEYNSMLCQRGSEKLEENKDIVSFEGEVEMTNMFSYGKDFSMGDIVQIANEYGHETRARIIELVTSDDENGISTYPTFSAMND